MPLEDQLKDLAEALRENTAAINATVKKADEIRAGREGNGAEASTRTRGKGKGEDAKSAEKSPAEEAIAYARAWLNDVPVELDADGDPLPGEENEKNATKREARSAFIKKCSNKLGVEKVSEITKAADVAKLIEWIEVRKTGKDPFKVASDDI